MKKFLFLVILFTNNAFIYADYHKFIEENKVWYVYYSAHPKSEYSCFYKYYFQGDSTINDIICKILCRNKYEGVVSFEYSHVTSLGKTEVVSLMREDTLNEKVNLRLIPDTFKRNNFTIFDFKLSVKDTFKHQMKISNLYNEYDIIVDSVNNIKLLNGQQVKRIHFLFDNYNSHIESIGNDDFFNWFNPIPALGTPIIFCVKKDGVNIFGEYCDIADAINKQVSIKNLKQSNLKIYPSLVNDYLTIENKDNHSLSMKIYSLEGKEMLMIKNLGRSETINVHALPKGFYIIKVENKGQTIQNEKIVKL